MSTETIVEPPKLKLIPDEVLEKIAALDDQVGALPKMQSLSEQIRESDDEVARVLAQGVPMPGSDPVGIKVEEEEGRAELDDLFDNLEKEIQAVPLEDGVTRADEPPTIEVQNPLGVILMDGKTYDVCPPVTAATSAQEPLYLLIEKTVGVSLRDAEKLLVFDWGLQHLKNRAPFNSNDGKRVLAMIGAIL